MNETPPGKLFAKALEISRQTPIETLVKKTGLPLCWLQKFRRGEIKSPGVQRVECLIVTITGRELL